MFKSTTESDQEDEDFEMSTDIMDVQKVRGILTSMNNGKECLSECFEYNKYIGGMKVTRKAKDMLDFTYRGMSHDIVFSIGEGPMRIESQKEMNKYIDTYSSTVSAEYKMEGVTCCYNGCNFDYLVVLKRL